MPLSDTQIRHAKPSVHPTDPTKNGRSYKLADGRGLFLLVTPQGGKWWRFKYRHEGKEKLLSLGTYPDISLKEAREKRDTARKQLANGIDPASHRKALKRAKSEANANSFEVVAREWFAKQQSHWKDSHASKVIRRLEQDAFPWIGSRPISDLEPSDLLEVLRRVESRGTHETAHRLLQNFGQIFRYAVATQRAKRDQAADLRGALSPAKEIHYPSLKQPHQIGQLLRAIDGYQGQFQTKIALLLAPLVFVRPGELRKAEWAEIDFNNAVWRIPPHKMKMGEEHIVPLARQALSLLTELKSVTGQYRYLFPGQRTPTRPMSENTLNAALRRLGYSKEEMTGHGFRSMASTRLHEEGLFPSEVIERQLAHGERNTVKRAYNHAQHLPKRKEMMRWWADYLDALKQDP